MHNSLYAPSEEFCVVPEILYVFRVVPPYGEGSRCS